MEYPSFSPGELSFDERVEKGCDSVGLSCHTCLSVFSSLFQGSVDLFFFLSALATDLLTDDLLDVARESSGIGTARASPAGGRSPNRMKRHPQQHTTNQTPRGFST